MLMICGSDCLSIDCVLSYLLVKCLSIMYMSTWYGWVEVVLLCAGTNKPGSKPDISCRSGGQSRLMLWACEQARHELWVGRASQTHAVGSRVIPSVSCGLVGIPV